MPLYEFLCASCQTRHELLISYAEIEGARCPDCDSELSRLLSAHADHRGHFAAAGCDTCSGPAASGAPPHACGGPCCGGS